MPRSAAGMIWPHLSQTKIEPQAQRRDTSPLARSMYPSLAPQPEPPAPRPRLTREQAFDWSDVDPETARLFGFVRKDRI
jgi:hypothetical protein